MAGLPAIVDIGSGSFRRNAMVSASDLARTPALNPSYSHDPPARIAAAPPGREASPPRQRGCLFPFSEQRERVAAQERPALTGRQAIARSACAGVFIASRRFARRLLHRPFHALAMNVANGSMLIWTLALSSAFI